MKISGELSTKPGILGPGLSLRFELHCSLSENRTRRERHWCRQLFERGLSHRGLPLKRKFRPRCCAKTRAGAPCIMRVVPGKVVPMSCDIVSENVQQRDS